MKNTYKALEVSAPGVLRVVERQVSEPGAGQARIRVEACGIRHTDAATVMGSTPALTLPRVPGQCRPRPSDVARSPRIIDTNAHNIVMLREGYVMWAGSPYPHLHVMGRP